tara:strand:- start:384 stop:539 length:156 start_codon:yes stop_codon:yes gene_type:complete
MVTRTVSYQLLGLGDVVALPSGQRKPQWVAETINTYMDLRAEPASAPAKGL